MNDHQATGTRDKIVLDLTDRPTSIRQLVRVAWSYRALIEVLARKDFYVRYRRAAFGLLWWAVIPCLQAAVLAFVVSRFARFDTSDNFVVYVLSGTVAWATFSSIVSGGATAVVDGSNLSSKIYFPRMVLPLAVTLTNLYGLFISGAVLVVVSVLTGEGLGLHSLLLVPAAILVLMLGGSFALVLCALHVYFRDVRYIVQAALMVWIYLTPVMYPLDVLGSARPFIEANPTTGVVELFRAATVGADPGYGTALGWTFAWIVVLVTIGLVLHRHFDRNFSDLL